MDGFLDELDQAWLTVDFGHGVADFLIDTGFAGGLIIGEELFDPTKGLPPDTSMPNSRPASITAIRHSILSSSGSAYRSELACWSDPAKSA